MKLPAVSLTKRNALPPLNNNTIVCKPTTHPNRFKLGDAVNVVSRVSTGERVSNNSSSKLAKCILNGYVTYIHPDYIFICVNNGRYTEAYYPSEVSSGWATDKRSEDPTADTVLPYQEYVPETFRKADKLLEV